MARTYTRGTMREELARARAEGWEACCLAAETRADLPRGLLLAIASRETDMNDVVGDRGHGRGLFQIDDRSHGSFLVKHGAAGGGRKPPVKEAAHYAAGLVRSNLDYGARKGVPDRERLKFALSAYNAGPGGALKGWQESGDSDSRTTGADYGRDVLARFAHFQALLGGGGGGGAGGGGGGLVMLRRGSRGRRVEELKAKLVGWYDRHAPGEYERFGVNPGRGFGVALERAVRDFQGRAGLEVDGVAGPKTFAALDR